MLALFAILPTRRPALQSAGMATLTKSKKPPVRKPAAKRAPKAKNAGLTRPAGSLRLGPRDTALEKLALPPAKSTAADLLKIKDFGKGLDGERVTRIVADRAR